MTVTAVRKDPEALTMVLTAEFDASPTRVWELWADPRQLERWWGPPTYPATFTVHDLAPGSRVEYHMTGPTGDQPRGFWDIVEADPPRRLVFIDGFANDDGTPNDDLPRGEGRVTIEPIDAGRTRMSIESRFPNTAAMEQVLAMGMEEGLTQAVGQIDAILAEDAVRTSQGQFKYHQERRHDHDDRAHDPHPRRAGCRPHVRHPGGRSWCLPGRCVVPDRMPDGRGRVRHLAGHFTDRTVVTYDPRGVDRSVKPDPASSSSPEVHADDLHRILTELDAGPVDFFASSGGAVNALALVATHPEQVRTLVAHEPPLASVLPDRAGALALTEAIADTYQRSGFGAGMAHFIVGVSHQGTITPEFATQPGPDPAMFGMPAEDDGNRTDVLLAQFILPGTHYEPDFDALRAASTRIVMAAGAESGAAMAARGAIAVAERLATEPVMFPGDHGGFFGGEYGQAGEPDAFAAKLREVLED